MSKNFIIDENYLLFERMGCEFWKDDKARQESDIGNYRITTPGEIVPCKNGKCYCFEFGCYDRYDYRTISKKGGRQLKNPVRELTMSTAMHLDTQFTDKKGLSWRDSKMEKEFYVTPVKYTESNILKWVNSIATVKYDSIKYVATFEIKIKPGENFTPATKIHEYMIAHKIPEIIDAYGEKRYQLYTGIYQYYKYEITKSADREIVKFYLERVEDSRQ